MRSSQGGFSVAWEQYGSVMCSGFQELQQREEFVDMTIAADGHLVRVHQMVVGLASPFLKELLRSAPSPNPVLFLNNISHKILCCILEYMYTGEALVPANDLKTFIATGKALRVRGLEDMMVPEPVEHEVVEAATTLVHEASSNTPQTTITERPASITERPASITDRPASLKLKHDTFINVDDEPQSCYVSDMKPKKSHHTNTLPIPSKKRPINKKSDVTDDSQIPAKICKKRNTVEVTSDDDGADHWTHDAVEDSNQGDIQHEDDTVKIKSTLDEGGSTSKKVDLMFTVSSHGSRQLILNRYIYRLRHQYKDGRIRWECADNQSKKCHAMAVTMDNALVARFTEHLHTFHDKRIMRKVKNNAVFTSVEKVELRGNQN